jgi:Amt family ammonium transporter
MDLSQVPVDAAATGWVLVSAALTLLMTPAVGFFYGGMLRRNHVLGVIMQTVTTIGVVTVTWIAVGFSMAFGGASPVLGGLGFAGLTDLDATVPGFGDSGLPLLAIAAFQLAVAILTPALVTGAAAERWRFGAFLLFVGLWPVLVYAPVAHWVFAPSGWINRMGALDFAGGLVVQANAGAAALAMAVLLGRRRGWPQQEHRPHNLPLMMIGAALLWFGWFGLCGGAARTSDGVAATAVFNTVASAAAALLSWLVVERLRFGKGTTVGTASGAVAGLVAITPAAGYVTPLAAVAIGLLAGWLCQLLVGVKLWLRVDDALDVVAVHLGGGVIGAIGVGLFASKAVNPRGADGLFIGGGYGLLGVELVAVLAVVGYSMAATFLIGGLIDRLVGNRVRARQEIAGLDLSIHGESAYELTDDQPAPR